MSAMKSTEFMLNLSKQMVEEKGVAESTANVYIRSLYILNGKVPFKTLTFLKDVEGIDKKVGEYAESTQKALYATLSSILSLYKDKATYKKAYAHYFEKMMEKSKASNAVDTTEKTEKEKENWIDWKDVQSKHKELVDKVGEFSSKKVLNADEFNTLLNLVVLSLYTEVQPRRNQDYLNMVVVKKWGEQMEDTRNYLDLATNHFVFNKYKTQKTYGQQKIAVPPTLMSIINLYLKFHPLNKGIKTKSGEYSFLVLPDGSSMKALNSITRILNRIFGKKVGSSMLRHSFLSSKYDIDGMTNDASKMAHSVEEQKKYMRGKGESESEVMIPTA
jgi:hypothetical protein